MAASCWLHFGHFAGGRDCFRGWLRRSGLPRERLSETLKEGGRGSLEADEHASAGRFVAVEMALALVLLIGAGLDDSAVSTRFGKLIRAFVRTMR